MGLLVLFNAARRAEIAARGVGIGHVVINLPLCFAIIYSQMGEPPGAIERAARDLGAAEWQVLLLVTAADDVAGAVRRFFLSMTFSWDEFVIAFLLTRFETTLPVEIWNLLRSGLNPKTNAVGSLVFGVSIVLAILARADAAAPEAGVSAAARRDSRRSASASATTAALNDVSLAIAAGSYTVLLGPSGSGKTTLLSILGGFLVPDARAWC